MKIVHIAFSDTAGSMFFLCHALNKLTKHQAVAIRFLNNYLRWPVMISATVYQRATIRKMLYKADVIHFHINVKPFFSSLRLDPAKLKDKQILVYYHGSFLRGLLTNSEELQKENREYAPGHVATVSTPDLLEFLDPKTPGYWLPVCRPFDEITTGYGRSSMDLKAMGSFGRRKIVVFGHATTSVDKKGSKIFFKALTQVVLANPQVRSTVIINNPWDACIRKMATFDVALGSSVLFEMPKRKGQPQSYGSGYGLTNVEAGIFKIPSISLLSFSDAERYKKVAGEPPPLISWRDDYELMEVMHKLADHPKLRRSMGLELHTWMRKFHDERAVVNRYLEILREMKR